jgi:hypothetical protein
MIRTFLSRLFGVLGKSQNADTRYIKIKIVVTPSLISQSINPDMIQNSNGQSERPYLPITWLKRIEAKQEKEAAKNIYCESGFNLR